MENEIHGVLVAVDRGPVEGAKVKAVPVNGSVAKRGAAAGYVIAPDTGVVVRSGRTTELPAKRLAEKAYLGFIDYGPANSSEGRESVLALRDGTWQEAGPRRFTGACCEYFTLDLASDGTPYTVCEQFGPLAHRFSGGAWSQVGPASVSPGMGWLTSVAFVDGVPHVAYQDGNAGNRAAVAKLTPQGWSQMGSHVSQGAVRSLRLVAHGGDLHLAYVDEGLGYRASVKRLNGSAWELPGAAGFSNPMADVPITIGPAPASIRPSGPPGSSPPR